jgi:subtilisin family serine protease
MAYRSSSLRRVLLVAWALASVPAAVGQVVTEAAPPDAAVAAPGLPPSQRPSDVVTVMVELADPAAGVVYAQTLNAAIVQGGGPGHISRPNLDAARSAATSASRTQLARIEAAHKALLPTLASMARDGRVLFRTKSAYNGISLRVTRGQIAALAKLGGVKAVHVQTPKFLTAATDIDFLNVRAAWTTLTSGAPNGLHGENVKIAIIDTGLDYIHANFGGPGTPAAYASVTDVGPVPNAYFPTAKIPGGFDFAGDSYDANNQPVPHPDLNPMDSNGHGTGSASLVGGLGVNSDGSTYSGSYDNSANIGNMKISPGMAPGAQLYPLRVFGTTGSTNLVTQAIDYALDPNGDGSIADHMDIISMSLGSDSGYADDPDAVAASNAAAAGVIVVSAAGNAGDSYYIVSSPSVGSGTLSVAATFNNAGGFIYNASGTVNSPPAIAGQNYKAIYGSPSSTFGGGITGNLVYANPPDASSALTNAAQMAGNICMVDRGTVSFVVKVQTCQAAGAVAAIIVQSAAGSGTPYPIVMALDNTTNIPAVMIGLNDGATIKANLDVNRSGVNMTFADDNGFFSVAGTGPDTMPTYSSRGPRLGDSAIKPDIAAPAEVVGVAAALTGKNVMSFNGTSSATPHVAGIMALLKQLHPGWSVEQLMALAMNTATHDEFVGPTTGAGAQYGVGRVGAGRIDAGTASLANVVAYNLTNPGLVNVSFGIVEVPVDSSITLNKTIAVTNNGLADVTYNVTYVDATPVTGATFTVPTSVTVAAGQTQTFNVTFGATGNQLKHARDASAVANLPSARHWLTEKTGYVVLTPTSGPEPTLRVALYASPKPVASMHSSTLTPSGGVAFSVGLTGAPVNTGSSFNTNPQDIVGLVKPYELQYVSSQIANPPSDPNVIKYVGVTSDYSARGASTANTVINFLLEGFGNASTPSYQSSDKEIYIDVDGDGTFDYAIFLTSSANGTSSSNAYFPEVVNLSTGAGVLRFRTYAFTPSGSSSSRDTNAYNNSVVVIPILATDIGLAGTGQPTTLHYEVVTFDRTGAPVDDSGPLTYNLNQPGLDVGGGNLEPFTYVDLATSSMAVTYNAPNFLANGSKGLLLAHLHNANGIRTEVVNFLSYGATQSSLTYSSQVVNTTSPAQIVTIANNGAVAVTFSSVTATTQFGVTTNCATVAPMSTCTASVTFTPTGTGPATGTLTFSSASGARTVSLSGTGIAKQNQTISFAAAPSIAVSGTGSVNATATSFLPVTYASTTPAACSVNASTGLVNGIANLVCTITADQPGNATYNAAPQATQSFAIGGPVPQAISFGALSNVPYPTAPFTVGATGGASGNPVIFTSATPSVCSTTGTNGTTVTILAAGICRITANQAGNSLYAAGQVTQVFTVAGIFRAYLSKNGSDANPCTLALPCRLLPAAMTLVAEGGEIWMLDSANFNVGAVTVFKSVTITAVPGAIGSVVASNDHAIVVNNSATIELTLRNLVILNLSGAGNQGIRFLQGSQVTVEGSEIYGLDRGIYAEAAGGLVTVKSSTIRDNTNTGVQLTGSVIGSLDGVTLVNNAVLGIGIYNGANAAVTGSTISGGLTGAVAYASGGSTSRLSLSDTQLFGASVSAIQANTAAGPDTASILLEDTTITHNAAGVTFTGAGTNTVFTRGNNAFNFNGTDLVGGTLTTQASF